MNTFFKVLGILFTVLFVLAAAVQYNDPDAMQWLLYYGVAALASLLFTFNRLRVFWAVLLFLVFGFMTYKLWPNQFEGVTIGQGDITNIERAREALGMAIAGCAMVLFLIGMGSARKSKI